MLLRNGPALVFLFAVAAAGGCGGKSYVSTSLGKQHHIEPAVNRISEGKGSRDGAASTQRDLVEIQRHLSVGDFAAVKRMAAAILKRQPASVQAHTYMAVALDQTGDSAGAGEHYRRAAEAASNNGAVLGNYGIWLCDQGRATEAMGWFDRALALPKYAASPEILANSGVCAGKVGQQQRAERDLRRAVELDPRNPMALGALALREFEAGNAFGARAFSERRLAAAPADPKALLLASQIEQKLGDSIAAARYVSRLKTEFPDAKEARSSANGDGGRQ
jgi:type IV pilus assembly protein PilF